jgi:hypothetical protein
MSKHKAVVHLPAPTSAPAPRLAAQLVTAIGDIVAVGLCVIGAAMVVTWVIAGMDPRVREHPRAPQWERAAMVCWIDRRYGEMCVPEDRPPVRRHPVGY